MAATIECADGWTPFSGTGLCYKYHSEQKPWAEAREICQASATGSGDLASIPDQETNDFLAAAFPARAWIGATDEEEEGVWRWSDGSEFGFTNWFTDNPDGSDHVLFNWPTDGSGLWNDQSGVKDRAFICQSAPGITATTVAPASSTTAVSSAATDTSPPTPASTTAGTNNYLNQDY